MSPCKVYPNRIVIYNLRLGDNASASAGEGNQDRYTTMTLNDLPGAIGKLVRKSDDVRHELDC